MWLYIPKTTSASTPVEADLISDSDSRIQLLARSFTWNESFKQPRSWSTTLKRASWSQRLFGLIPEPSTANRLSIEWIGSLEASPASRGVSQVSNSEPKTLDGSGLISNGLLAKFNPEDCSWRMYQPLFQEADWPKFSGAWPRSGTMLNGYLYERPTLVRPTAGNGSSSWLTPKTPTGSGQAERTTPGGVLRKLEDLAENWLTPFGSGNLDHSGKYGAGGEFAKSVVSTVDNWPTTTARDDRATYASGNNVNLNEKSESWATPTGRDHKDGANPSEEVETNALLGRQAPRWATPKRSMLGAGNPKRKDQHRLVDEVASFHQDQETPMPGQQSSSDDQTSRRRLNYRFVEWMMGLPSNWTDFHALLGSGSSATESCPSRQRWRSESLPVG